MMDGGDHELHYADSKHLMEKIYSASSSEDEPPVDLYEDLIYSSEEDDQQIRKNHGYSDLIGGEGRGNNSKLMMSEVSKFIKLRTNLEELEEEQGSKRFAVATRREELLTSKNRTESLEKQLKSNEIELKKAKDEKNVAKHGLLQSKQERIKSEIEAETKLQFEIDKDLEQSELELLRTDINYKHMTDVSKQVRAKEDVILHHKEKKSLEREEKLQEQELLAENKWRKIEKETMNQMRLEDEQREKRFLNQTSATAKNKQFVQKTAGEVRQRRLALERARTKAEAEKMADVIGLKERIEEQREGVRAVEAQRRRKKEEKARREEEERERVMEEAGGGNPTTIIMERKMRERMKKEEREFERQQQVNRTKVIERMLEEERNLERRKQRQPYLFDDTRHKPHPDPAKRPRDLRKPVDERLKVGANGRDLVPRLTPRPPKMVSSDVSNCVRGLSSSSEEEGDDEKLSTIPSSALDQQPRPRHNNLLQQEESLARPEFEGIWCEEHEPYKVPTGRQHKMEKPMGGSVAEKRILREGIEKQRRGIQHKQVAGGREFRGQPFVSKPEVVHFGDLEVGQTYEMRVVITNVSYTINYLKMTGISEHLKDFVRVSFEPPGAMSAGMQCELHVTFKPMINKNLEGKIFFQAQTGNFSIPIRCSVKRCELSVDSRKVDFGKEVIGERVLRHVTLRNSGALPARFRFRRVSGEGEDGGKRRWSGGEEASSSEVSLGDVTQDEYSENVNSGEVVEDKEDKSARRESHQGAADDNNDANNKSSYESSKSKKSARDGDSVKEEISVGRDCGEGLIEAHSSVQLSLVFLPAVPGTIDATFRLEFEPVNKSDDDDDDDNEECCKDIDIRVCAVASDVPVWLERKEIDLRICIVDRLYQDQIVVRNRAKYALRLTFEVPKQLRDHMELLPKTGYIQSKSSFTAQLKFLPRSTLAKDAGPGMFDPEMGVLQAPMLIRVAEQTRPVSFNINAVVTSSDLSFDTKLVDFGTCSIYEEVTRVVRLTNHSILPQNFGFVNVPDFMDVQPNDGFGKILPLETIEIDVIMKAQKARHYDVTLVCKSSINRDFEIRCCAVGVHPPLSLSHQIIKFAATALYDVRSEVFDVINSHCDANEFTHPVPRIGKGPIAAVGPTSFEFILPDDAPFTIQPLVGTVMPGEKCQVSVEFGPQLPLDDIRKEAVEIIKTRLESSKKLQSEDSGTTQNESSKQSKSNKSKSHSAQHENELSNEGSAELLQIQLPQPQDIDPNSAEFLSAMTAAMQKFEGKFKVFSVPCLVATGKCSIDSKQQLKYDAANTIYLELFCPIIRPPIIVISNGGNRKLNFGQISIGLNTIEAISILNISDELVQLTCSLLDVCGPFHIVNATRPIQPGETHTMKVAFAPIHGKIYHEKLKIYCAKSTLELTLIGEGVTPVVHVEPRHNTYLFDRVVEGENSCVTYTLVNKSSLSVDWQVDMDSFERLCVTHGHSNQKQGGGKNQQQRIGYGIQNHSGSDVFECYPASGSIGAGDSCQITITFRPDHASRHYFDAARLVLFGTKLSHVWKLEGEAYSNMMYVTGCDSLDSSDRLESFQVAHFNQSEGAGAATKPMLVSFVSESSVGGELRASKRTLQVGCIRSVKFAAKKSVECIVENFQAAQAKGFSFDSMKFSVDVGTIKPLTITWNPLREQDIGQPVTSSFTFVIKGDVVVSYDVTLAASFAFK